MSRRLLRSAFLVAAIVTSGKAIAATTVYELTGTITNTTEIEAVFGSDFVGKTFSGTLTYDPLSTPDWMKTATV